MPGYFDGNTRGLWILLSIRCFQKLDQMIYYRGNNASSGRPISAENTYAKNISGILSCK